MITLINLGWTNERGEYLPDRGEEDEYYFDEADDFVEPMQEKKKIKKTYDLYGAIDTCINFSKCNIGVMNLSDAAKTKTTDFDLA